MLSSGILSGHFEILRQDEASCHIFCWRVFCLLLVTNLYALQAIVHKTLKDLETNLWSSIWTAFLHNFFSGNYHMFYILIDRGNCRFVALNFEQHASYGLNLFADMSFQAAQRVMSSDPQRALKVLRDLSQNLPMQTRCEKRFYQS